MENIEDQPLDLTSKKNIRGYDIDDDDDDDCKGDRDNQVKDCCHDDTENSGGNIQRKIIASSTSSLSSTFSLSLSSRTLSTSASTSNDQILDYTSKLSTESQGNKYLNLKTIGTETCKQEMTSESGMCQMSEENNLVESLSAIAKSLLEIFERINGNGEASAVNDVTGVDGNQMIQLMTSENIITNNSRDFKRYKATEECGMEYCSYAGQRTTHFHCEQINCRFTFKNKSDIDKHKAHHQRNKVLEKEGFKKFLKHESCAYECCPYNLIHNHIHCLREGCSSVFHSTNQLLSHKKKHNRTMELQFIPHQNITTFQQQNIPATFQQQSDTQIFQQLQQNVLDLTCFAQLSEQIENENQEVLPAAQTSEDIDPNPSQFTSETVNNKKRKLPFRDSNGKDLQTDDNVSNNEAEVSTTSTTTSSTTASLPTTSTTTSLTPKEIQNATEPLLSTISRISGNKEFSEDYVKIASVGKGETSEEIVKRIKLSSQEFQSDVKNIDVIAEATEDQKNIPQLNEELDLSQHLLKFCGIQFPNGIHEVATNLSKPHETCPSPRKLLRVNEHGNYFIRSLQNRSIDFANSAQKIDSQSSSKSFRPSSGIRKIYLKAKNSNSEAYVFALKPQNKVIFLKDSRVRTSEGGSQQVQQQSLLTTVVDNKSSFNNSKMFEEFLRQKRKEQKRVKDETWKKFLTRYTANDPCTPRCQYLYKDHYHCKVTNCGFLFRSKDGVRGHAKLHEQQNKITELHFSEHSAQEDCQRDCRLKFLMGHYHCLWDKCGESIIPGNSSFQFLGHYKMHKNNNNINNIKNDK